MNKQLVFSILIFLLGLSMTFLMLSKDSPDNTGTTTIRCPQNITVQPFFCPEDHCSHVVVYWITRANHSIDLAIYSFTLDPIGDALVNAHRRGVKIRVIFEKTQINQWSEYNKLKKAGIQVMIDRNDKYMHNKFMVIDGKVVLTGSYNYTNSADKRNDENLVVIVGEEVASAYEEEFNEMWSGTFGGG